MKFSTVAAFFALFGKAIAAPTQRASIMGEALSGVGFATHGDVTAGAAADENSGVASSALDGLGTVLGLAGPGLATAVALSTPSI